MSEFHPWNAPEIQFAETVDVAKLQAERNQLRIERDKLLWIIKQTNIDIDSWDFAWEATLGK